MVDGWPVAGSITIGCGLDNSMVDPLSGSHGVQVLVPAGCLTPPLIAPITQVEICGAPPEESEVV